MTLRKYKLLKYWEHRKQCTHGMSGEQMNCPFAILSHSASFIMYLLIIC